MWMFELIPTQEDKFSAHLIVHAIESVDKKTNFPRKLLITPTIHRHLHTQNQFYL